MASLVTVEEKPEVGQMLCDLCDADVVDPPSEEREPEVANGMSPSRLGWEWLCHSKERRYNR